jgi:FAD/FMN-containing dehydrogenase
MDYLQLITLLDAGSPTGLSYYEKAHALNVLSNEMIDVIVEYASSRTSPLTKLMIQHLHGAACRVDPAATAAFALRNEQYDLAIVSAWDGGEVDQAKRHLQWTRTFWEAMEPMAMKGLYVYFINDEGEERIRAAYGTNYERLVALKKRYDPANFFRFNHNIKPTVNL